MNSKHQQLERIANELEFLASRLRQQLTNIDKKEIQMVWQCLQSNVYYLQDLQLDREQFKLLVEN